MSAHLHRAASVLEAMPPEVDGYLPARHAQALRDLADSVRPVTSTTREDILRAALEHIATASGTPPVGSTWQDRCAHWRQIAHAALIAAEGG